MEFVETKAASILVPRMYSAAFMYHAQRIPLDDMGRFFQGEAGVGLAELRQEIHVHLGGVVGAEVAARPRLHDGLEHGAEDGRRHPTPVEGRALEQGPSHPGVEIGKA
jgi:hypothetical protein